LAAVLLSNRRHVEGLFTGPTSFDLFRSHTMKTLLLAMVLLSGGLTFGGCTHTSHGVARDLDHAGDKVEHAAHKAGDKMEDVADDMD
jgi:predicted small secreted protein